MAGQASLLIFTLIIADGKSKQKTGIRLPGKPPEYLLWVDRCDATSWADTSSPKALATCWSCPSTFTLFHPLRTTPSPSIRNVERAIPIDFLPKRTLSRHAPNLSAT